MNATIEQDATQLLKILNANKVSPDVLEQKVPAFSTESKDEAVRRVSKQPRHEPSGRLLARLWLVCTPSNQATMSAVFEANLDSPDPAARRSSLYGLEKLEHPRLTQLALPLLGDADDTVLYAACHVLLPPARGDLDLWQKLQAVYRAHKGDEKFHMSMALLEAHDIGRTSGKARRLGEE